MFDPHNHFDGILPYRVLALLAGPVADDELGGKEIARRLLQPGVLGKAITAEIGFELNAEDPDLADLESYLAHHEINRPGLVVKVKPPDSDWTRDRKQGDPLKDIMWVSPEAYRDGVTHRIVTSEALARLELVLIARLYAIVARMLPRAKATVKDNLQWAGKAKRLASGSGVLDLVIDILGREPPPPYRQWLENPQAAKLELAKPIKRILQNVFTATPLTDFDTAYVTRGFLSAPLVFPDGPRPLPDRAARLAASLRELKRQGITYAEVSAGGDDIVATLNDPKCVSALAAAATGDGGVRIKWLAHVPNSCVVDPSPEFETPFELVTKLVARALEHPETIGFSILAPETSNYGAFPRTVETRLGQLLKLCNAAPKTGERPKAVAHIHVGEGAPVWDLTPKVRLDLLEGKRSAIPPAVNAAATEVRGDEARANITAILDALPKSIPENIRVRFGHVSHAAPDQAQRMKANEIWADVNLTSNAATSAWFIGGAVDVKRLKAKDYAGHGVSALADAGTKFVLGTDGSGVEHSAMLVEFDILKELADSQAPRASWVEQARANAREHMTWIWGRAADGSAR